MTARASDCRAMRSGVSPRGVAASTWAPARSSASAPACARRLVSGPRGDVASAREPAGESSRRASERRALRLDAAPPLGRKFQSRQGPTKGEVRLGRVQGGAQDARRRAGDREVVGGHPVEWAVSVGVDSLDVGAPRNEVRGRGLIALAHTAHVQRRGASCARSPVTRVRD